MHAWCAALVVGGVVAKPICILPWAADSSLPRHVNTSASCPYGHANVFDVTVPSDPSFAQWVCVIYGIVPLAVVGFAALDCLFTATFLRGIGTRELSFIGFVAFIVVLNEAIIKRISHQARPEHSCNLSCGLPSGHSTMSIGFYVLMFLDASFRVMPKVPQDVASARLRRRALKSRRSVCGFSCRDVCVRDIRTWFTIIPLSSSDTLSAFDFTCFAACWGFLLLPVPMSRIVLHDHTPLQALVGSLVGFIEAVAWFALMRYGVKKQWNHMLGARICCIFVHNFSLPRFEVVGKCCEYLAQAEDDEAAYGNMSEILILKFTRVYSELGWYLKQLERPACLVDLSFDEDRIFADHEKVALKAWRDKVQERLQSCGKARRSIELGGP